MIIFQKTSGNFHNYLAQFRYVGYTPFNFASTTGLKRSGGRTDLLMPLNENRVELTEKVDRVPRVQRHRRRVDEQFTHQADLSGLLQTVGKLGDNMRGYSSQTAYGI